MPTTRSFAPSFAHDNHIITPEGVWRVPPAQFIGTAAQVGAALAAEATVPLPNVGTLPSTGDPFSVIIAGGVVHVGVRLCSLRFNTHFQVTADRVARPVFTPERGSVRLNLEWVCPENADILLGVTAQMPGADGARWTFSKAYFAMSKPGVGGFFNPPLPNIYDDGSVCLGVSERHPVRSDSLSGLVEEITTRFHAAPWNTDLLQGRDAGRMFSFRMGENTASPIYNPDWEQSCRRVSHPAFARCVLPPRRPAAPAPVDILQP